MLSNVLQTMATILVFVFATMFLQEKKNGKERRTKIDMARAFLLPLDLHPLYKLLMSKAKNDLPPWKWNCRECANGPAFVWAPTKHNVLTGW